MSAIPAFLSWFSAKDSIYIISIARDDIKKSRFASRLEVSYPCLDHMTSTVELMSVSEICPSLLRLDNCIVWIEVTIWLLCRSDKCDHLIKQCIKLWVRMCCQAITSSFYPFRNVRVPKLMRCLLHTGLPI